MNRFMKTVLWTCALAMPISMAAQAQFSGYGYGMWGAQQNCGYKHTAGNGSSSQVDGIREAASAANEIQRKIDAVDRKIKTLESAVERSKDKLDKHFEYEYFNVVDQHITDGQRCEERTNPAPFSAESWTASCDPQRAGFLKSTVCSAEGARRSDSRRSDCPQQLETFARKSSELRRAQSDREKLEERKEIAEERAREKAEDLQAELEERQQGQTEGRFCYECMMQGGSGGGNVQSRGTDWGGVISNVATGLVGIYAANQQQKAISRNNAAIGWPTQPYSSVGYGLPFIQAGIYGALGGGIGQGAFGCASGMNGTGNFNGPNGMNGPFGGGSMYGMPGYGNNMFGFPQNMMGGPMSGGMYNQGMGPWGMNGPFAMNGQFQMNPYGMNGVNGMNGMNPYGMMNGGMNPFGVSGQFDPYGMNGMNGMNPYGMNGMPGVNPYGMNGMNGMNPYGMAGQFNPFGNGMNGMNPYGLGGGLNGMMNPYGMNNGMMNPYGMNNGMMTPQAMQYQQQMQQMQMQQYQLQMQMQQQAQQNMMQRQQAVSGLQQEVYSLVARIQQIQMGADIGVGGSLGGSFGTSPQFPGQSYLNPQFGSIPTTGNGTIMQRGSTGAPIYNTNPTIQPVYGTGR